VPQAILKRPPAFFAAKGIEFRTELDDLNEYQVAELALDDLPFALMRHAGTPPDETEVYLPDNVPLSHLSEAIGRILKELDLPSAVIGWQRQTTDKPY
jgi:hypothetical protein